MEQGQQFSHLIYEYFCLRFHFGYYRFGDFLPPVNTFCQEFCVAPETVKNALRRLRDEGYIDMGRGRMTRVLFEQSVQEQKNFFSEFFSVRWSALEDLYISAELLFAPLETEGLRRMSLAELEELSRLADRAGEDDLFHLYCSIIQKLENPLAMNFFWEVILFQGFSLARWAHKPTQYSVADVQNQARALLSAARERRWDCVQNTLINFQRVSLRRTTEFLIQQVQPLPKEQQIPFVWRIYHDRPQIYCNLTSRLLHEIYMGEYRHHSYLPPYAELAAKYNVSVNTIRRSVGILNQLGVAQSINGKGTRIFPLGKRCNPPDFTDPIIRRNLAFYVQSFELVKLTCESVTRSVVTHMSQEEKEMLINQLDENLRCGVCDISLWNCLLAITHHSPLQVVREFYRTAYSLFLWGYPLKASRDNIPFLDQSIVRFTEDMIWYLKENNVERCASIFKELMEEKFGKAEAYLLKQGIRSEELWPSRTIRFFSLENGTER